MTDDAPSLGELLRRKRRSVGLNQQGLADRLAVNQSTVAKWERGDRPAPDKLAALAAFLDLPLSRVLALHHGAADAEPDHAVAPIVRSLGSKIAGLRHEVADLAAAIREATRAMTQRPTVDG